MTNIASIKETRCRCFVFPAILSLYDITISPMMPTITTDAAAYVDQK